MQRIHVICEGQTEEMFVNEVMGDHFQSQGIYLQPALLGKPGHKGGNVQFQRVLRDIELRLLGDTSAYCTTFLDFYGLPESFPGKAQALLQNDLNAKSQMICTVFSQELEKNLGANAMRRFVPHIQFYEFEGLLFSNPQKLANESGHAELQQGFQQIRDQFDSPEHINNDPNTAPSKRIQELIREYDKVIYGSLIALDIGLEEMRRECTLFDSWIGRLLALSGRDVIVN
jgi:hypothetical protein